MDLQSRLSLNNGVEIPQLGFGLYLSKPGKTANRSARWALETGYRHIDTASLYENEADVGRAIRESGIDRDEIFVTTKVWRTDLGYEPTLRAFDVSRKKLGIDVLDLYLVHWPFKENHFGSWKAMEKLYGEGKVRAIGVSNFLIHHVNALLEQADVVPVVNQVEFHPFLLQKDLLEYGRQKGILHEAWSPLVRGTRFDDPVIRQMADKYGRSPAQILIRWDLQMEVVTIPKSDHRDRIVENSEVFDFEIAPEDMDRITALDEDGRIGPHPEDVSRA